MRDRSKRSGAWPSLKCPAPPFLSRQGSKKPQVLANWVVQLVPLGSEDLVLYCRFADRRKRRFVEGQHYFARGLVIAAGRFAVPQVGFRPGVYMACSSLAKARGHELGTGLPLPPGDRRLTTKEGL